MAANLAEVLHGLDCSDQYRCFSGKGARTALITTKGFRMCYAIGRGNRIERSICSFTGPPLVARDLTCEFPSGSMLAVSACSLPPIHAASKNFLVHLRKRRVEGGLCACFTPMRIPPMSGASGEISRAISGYCKSLTLSH